MTRLPTDAARWQRVKRLLDRALQIPPGEQEEFLDDACAADPSLRREIDSLLVHVGAGDTLEVGVARVAAEALELRATVDLRGRRLGPWQIDEKIGEGGMGAVYRAERADGAFTKRVAIKVVREHVADESGRRRFYAEREILASIEHPHIARLIDAGTTEEGLPYLVMEYVEGEPVDAYCDDQRLTVDERLALFRLVCDAVQSAHDRRVVHRDIKPSNVLITANGTPKLLDFGIAKLLAPEMLDRSVEVTSEAQRLMTPAYCSPEQIRGEPITPASDVYSLGVILYGLLCGHSPYEQLTGAQDPIETIVCDREPMPPSRALRGFDQAVGPEGEPVAVTPEAVAEARNTDPEGLFERLDAGLDGIVMRALAKRPFERYATAAELGRALDEQVAPGPAPAPETRGSAPDPADAAATTVGSSRSPATLVEWGHLEIRDKVGEGMFGRVYRCRDPSLERTVALKLFRSPSGDASKLTAEVAGRVLREGRLMARVRHPNVLSVYGVAVHDETVGMWMEYIDGKNLEEVLEAHGRFSAGEACLVGIELCSALAAVHGQGLVHRDIKAHNVIREDGGRIVLTDFGSGGDLMGAMPLQGEGAVGTPLYMAPEVLRGGVATARADIYGLGVLLFRLVTGEFPVEADTWAGLIEKHERGERKLTRDLRPDLKPRLAQVLDTALSPRPEDRFDSAAKMQRALEMATDLSIEPLHLSPTPVIADDFTVPRDDPAGRESLYQTVTAIGTSVLGALFLLGFTTTTAYRQALRIPQRFWSESPLVLPVKGLNALVPVVVEMVFELVVLGVLAALALLIFVIVDRLQRGKDLRGRARRSLGRARARMESVPPEVTHALLLISGLIGVALVIYWHREILGVVMSLSDAQASRSIDATLLTNLPGPAGQSLSLTFTVATLILVLCAGLAAFAAFGREVPRDGKLVPVLRAGIIGVILFAAIVAAIPWRLVWDNNHERVLVDGETAFVIAENGDQAWLYYPRDNRTEMLDLTSPGRSVQRNQPFNHNIFTEPPQQ